MGIMGVQPKPSDGLNHPSAPPGDFCGNLDLRDLVVGTTLYLPIYVPGALLLYRRRTRGSGRRRDQRHCH